MDEIQHIETITEYNDLCGFKTMHPQVAYVEFHNSPTRILGKHTYGFYTLFFKETKGCVINYGQTQYDFDCETVVSMAPKQVVESRPIPGVPKHAIGVLFHPDFLHGTPLAKKMKEYSFFSYASNEALHLSEDEVQVVHNCMHIIDV